MKTTTRSQNEEITNCTSFLISNDVQYPSDKDNGHFYGNATRTCCITSVDNEATPMLISDVHCSWKHGRRVPRDRLVCIEIDDDSLRGAAKSLKLTPFAAIRYMDPSGKQSQQETSNLAKRLETEYVECILNPAVFRKLLERDDHIVSCNLNRRYHRRQLSWKLQNPFYVEEPNWVEINNDDRENHSRHNLETVDPYIISRGKKFHERLSNIVNDTRSGESSIEYEDLRVILADNLKMMRDKRSTNSNSRHDHDEGDNGNRRDENLKKTEKEDERKHLNDVVAGDSKMNSNTRLEENENKEDEHLKNTKSRSVNDLKLINSENPLFAGVYNEQKEYLKNGEFESGESTFNKQKDKRGLIFKKTPYSSGNEIVSRAIHTPKKTSRMPVELATASRNAIGEKGNSLLFYVRMKRDSKPANSAVVKNIAVESAYRPNRVRETTNYSEREQRNGVGGLDVLNDILEQPYFISRGKKINNKEEKKISFERLESEEPTSTMDSIISGERLREDLTKCRNRMNEKEKRIEGLEDHFGIDMKGLVNLEQPYFISRGKKVNNIEEKKISFEQLESEESKSTMDSITDGKRLREDLNKCRDRMNEKEKRIEGLEDHFGIDMKGLVNLEQPYFFSRGKKVNNKEEKKISFERLESEEPKSTMDSIIDEERLRKDLNKCRDRMNEKEKRIKKLEDYFGIDMKGLVNLEQPYFISRGKKNNYEDDGRILFEQLKSEMDDIIGSEKLSEDLKCDWSECEDPTNEREKRIKELEHHLGIEMKGIVKELLTNFDPYYVARGKRVLLPSLSESF
ncbi:hypothetical protein K0M31_018408 [Melipona bicolor]|uniref:Uncharacterized protein n=1 Tax=Melipona bicolor TaxID=60889 RepID=A0AA40KRN8_9HYME|nr:hypothetical protein K0M31_018408 [Melipona bicolor]